jgi:hypothetical protein
LNLFAKVVYPLIGIKSGLGTGVTQWFNKAGE